MEPSERPEQTLSPLGEGAMARVYRARHPKYGDIAVKVLRHNDPGAWKRLQREAAAQSRLNHPNIGRVFGFGSFEGQPAILMQRVDGRPLDVVAGELPLEARVDLLVSVCDAVEHAHAAGLIHRDLKPGNVLVEEHEGRLHPYVLDFGLVHDADARSLTGAGELLGTPAYMSPEQARGDARHVDRRSDVFSLGAMLFQLLTGRPPFRGRSVSEVLGQILSNDAPLAHRVSRNVPLALSRICAQCLERDPARRYASAAALRQDLQHWLRGKSLQARSVGLRYRSARWLRRNRLASWAFGAAVVTALLALGWSLHARKVAAEREQQVAQLAEASQAVRQRMRLLRLAPPQDLSSAVAALTQELQALDQRGRALGGAGSQRIGLALAQAWLDLEQPDKAIAALQDAAGSNDAESLRLLAESRLARYRNLSAALSDQSIEGIEQALGEEGRDLREGARTALQEAARLDPVSTPRAKVEFALLERQFAEALQVAKQYRPTDLADYSGAALQARILAEQARFAESSGDLDQASTETMQAMREFDSALQVGRSDGRLLESACRTGAMAIRIEGNAGKAALSSPGASYPSCDVAVQVRPDRFQSWSARALAWSAIAATAALNNDAEGEHHALLAMQRDASEASQRSDGRPEPMLLLAKAQVRIAQLRLGGFEPSLAAYNQAIETLERLRRQQPGYVPVLHELGIAYRQRGRLRGNYDKDPEQDFTLAIEVLDAARQLQPDAVDLADDLSLTYVFAFYDQRSRDPDAARAMGERAIAVIDEVLAREPAHPGMLSTQIANLADLWAYLRSLEAGEAPGRLAPLRERAHQLAARLREVAPKRSDGHTSVIMLELTAAEYSHDRQLSDATAIQRASELIDSAHAAELEVPAEIEAWFATERLRETLRTAAVFPEAEWVDARSKLQPAMANEQDVDEQLLARLTDVELAVAELQWRQRNGQSVDAVIRRGLAQYQRLRDSGHALGNGDCNGGELLLASARLGRGVARKRDAGAAATAFQSCIDGSPFGNAYRRPSLEAARALQQAGP